MSIQTISLAGASRMMIEVQIDKEKRRIRIRFADGCAGWIPAGDIEQVSPQVLLDLDRVNLPNPYEIIIGTEEGGTIELPWDFIRGYCDPHFQEREREQAQDGRTRLGERIRRFRQRSGWTQADLAKRAGMGRVTLSRLESGVHSPRYRTLVSLAKALEVSITELLADRPLDDKGEPYS
jgi:DNA-binding XRE family transcriptional regulator